MHGTTTARRTTRWTLTIAVIGLVIAGALTATLLAQTASSAASSSAPSAFAGAAHGDHRGASYEADGVVTHADGILPAGATVFDDRYPAIASLDPDLLAALRAAAGAAAAEGIEFEVNSGWRSPEYQDQLLRDAVVDYGSDAEAARWVATADTSAHVSGDAVDIAIGDATAWLAEYGAGYGLCRIYDNEPWHYELRPDAVAHGCPPTYLDPTHDPRLRR